MRTLPWARSLAVAPLLFLAATSCGDISASSGAAGLGAANASLSFASALPDEGEPIVPIRQARVRLFRLPGAVPEIAALDTTMPFGDADDERTFTVGLTLTMVSERFALDLTLLDDENQVVYHARDTVVASITAPPAGNPIVLRYVGPDTAVARLSLSAADTAVAIGDSMPIQVTAFRRDGRSTSARYGFVVRGTSSLLVSPSGTVRAVAPVARGAAWIVARVASGLSDSIALAAVVPARTLSLGAASARLTVGGSMTFTSVARDSTGAVLAGRRPTWSSSNPSVATVLDGVATGVAQGSTLITAKSDRAVATVLLTVVPARVATLTPSTGTITLRAGQSVALSVLAADSVGAPLPSARVSWVASDASIAGVATTDSIASAPVMVRGLKQGTTTLIVSADSAQASIKVAVGPPIATSVTIAPGAVSLVLGGGQQLTARVRDASGNDDFTRRVAWSSSSSLVASVDVDGFVRGASVGNASIVASVDGVADTIAVSVRQVARISVTPARSLVKAGETIRLSVVAFDASGVVIDGVSARWDVFGKGSILDRDGQSTRVTMTAPGYAEVRATVGSLTAQGLVELPAATPGEKR